MARLFGYLASHARPDLVVRHKPWLERLEALSANCLALERGKWESSSGTAAVLYVASARSPYRAFQRDDGPLFLVEGTVHFGDKLLGALDVAELHRVSGDDFVNQLQGAFCILALDAAKNLVKMFRDRWGLKPMFYLLHDGVFYFSSYASLLADIPSGKREPNPEIIALYATSHYSTVYGRKNTFFRNVSQILPAAALSWHDGQLSERVYWRFDASQPFFEDKSERQLHQEMAALLEKAITQRVAPMPSKKGFSLSGGMDSNTVLGYVCKLMGEKQVAVSVTYPMDDRANELDLIEPVARRYLREWHNIQPTVEKFKNEIANLYAHYDQPWTTATVYAQERLNRGAAEAGLQCLISGSGGDHHMAGAYPNFLHFFAYLKNSGQEELLRHEVRKWIEHHSVPRWPKSYQTVENFFRNSVDIRRAGVLVQGEARLCPSLEMLSDEYAAAYRLPPPVESYGDYVRSYTVQEITKDALPPAIWAEDIMGWRYGITGCDPFWDLDLFEYTWCIPHRYKIRDGVNKYLIRRITDSIVPDHIRLRVAKTGFNLPFDQWLRSGLGDLVQDTVGSRRFRERGVLRAQAADRVLREHLAGEVQHGMLIWQILNLELWFQQWIETAP